MMIMISKPNDPNNSDHNMKGKGMTKTIVSYSHFLSDRKRENLFKYSKSSFEDRDDFYNGKTTINIMLIIMIQII